MGVLLVRRATIEDLDAAADTLAEAFEGYPWTRHVLLEEGYEERLRALQLLYLLSGIDPAAASPPAELVIGA